MCTKQFNTVVCTAAFLLAVVPCALAAGADAIKANTFVNACQYFKRENGTASDDQKTESDLHKNLCLAYLQGYFAASNDIIAEESLPSSFTLRALRTRGHRLSEYQQKLLNSRYCISEQESLQDFAEKVAVLDAEFDDDAPANEAVEMVLEQYYVCDR